MQFRVNVNLTDEDYYEFNKFFQFCTPAGKKQFFKVRILATLIPVLFLLVELIAAPSEEFYIIAVVMMLLLSVVMFLISKPMFWAIAKAQLKKMKKSGKLPFSYLSTIEFYEDYFVEYTQQRRTQEMYSAVNAVYLVNSKTKYIFNSLVSGYIIPVSAFATEAEYNRFVNFISAKTKPVNAVSFK